MSLKIINLILLMCVSAGCTLENRKQLLNITAHTGGSVLLPCYCTDLHTTPEGFSWKKYNRNRREEISSEGGDNRNTTNWEDISRESGQYRNRVQLVNGHSPGNLSLLISHLTEEDEGDYYCEVKGSVLNIRLTVKGCTLVNREQLLNITAHTGGSVLLPCYCTDQRKKSGRFSWKKDNRNTTNWEEISSESGQYRNRVQLVNGHSPGNLSLRISHLTEEDDGFYICAVKEPPQSLPFIPFALVTVIFLHIIVAVVYHTKRNKDPARVHYSTADGDGVVSLE
ncbi:junctional adhesion molecule-like [Colossoma macropomum]|uniref:junctional adhesion molecule-like n=1 Tax=Colossoma macropomum TaxID=42526 RepID=UPI001863B74B|nr:junctional adhesion molecule-like [Colossoma macropomum]